MVSGMKRFLLSAVLLSSLAWNAAFAAETNHNFAKWEKDMVAFEQSDQTNPPPQNAILFIGSSSIRLWKTLAADFPEAKVINRGFGGSEIADSTHFADRILFPYHPRKIFLRAGGNDLWAGKSADEVFRDYTQFVETVHARLPAAVIYFIGWNPTLARWSQLDKEKSLNQQVQGFIKGKPYLKYIETSDMVLGADGKPRAELFVSDKLHFSPAGYELLVKRVRPFVLE